jgi:hypothetical protein
MRALEALCVTEELDNVLERSYILIWMAAVIHSSASLLTFSLVGLCAVRVDGKKCECSELVINRKGLTMSRI